MLDNWTKSRQSAAYKCDNHEILSLKEKCISSEKRTKKRGASRSKKVKCKESDVKSDQGLIWDGYRGMTLLLKNIEHTPPPLLAPNSMHGNDFHQLLTSTGQKQTAWCVISKCQRFILAWEMRGAESGTRHSGSVGSAMQSRAPWWLQTWVIALCLLVHRGLATATKKKKNHSCSYTSGRHKDVLSYEKF